MSDINWDVNLPQRPLAHPTEKPGDLLASFSVGNWREPLTRKRGTAAIDEVTYIFAMEAEKLAYFKDWWHGPCASGAARISYFDLGLRKLVYLTPTPQGLAITKIAADEYHVSITAIRRVMP